jgi:outer membrane lipoprotein-sorting protein
MMKLFFLFLLALTAPPNDPIDAALESFSHVNSYRLTLHSNSGGSSEYIRYYFKRPGFVRMEFIKPHKGAVLVYNPFNKKARLRPFGFFSLLVLTLAPDNSLITSPRGHHVDASDLGSFLETVQKLADHGKVTIKGNEKAGERETLLVEVIGAGDVTVDSGVHCYLLWLDDRTLLPVRTKSFNLRGEPVEDVVMDDLEINVELPESLFEM